MHDQRPAGHHVDGGSTAAIFVVRGATTWLRFRGSREPASSLCSACTVPGRGWGGRRPAHDVQPYGLMRVAAKTTNLEVPITVDFDRSFSPDDANAQWNQGGEEER
jgi:hypothetical protein